jgi:hypothetical protein
MPARRSARAGSRGASAGLPPMRAGQHKQGPHRKPQPPAPHEVRAYWTDLRLPSPCLPAQLQNWADTPVCCPAERTASPVPPTLRSVAFGCDSVERQFVMGHVSMVWEQHPTEVSDPTAGPQVVHRDLKLARGEVSKSPYFVQWQRSASLLVACPGKDLSNRVCRNGRVRDRLHGLVESKSRSASWHRRWISEAPSHHGGSGLLRFLGYRRTFGDQAV